MSTGNWEVQLCVNFK